MSNKIKHFYIIKNKNAHFGKDWYDKAKFLIGNYDYKEKLWLLERDNGSIQATIRPNMIFEYIEFLLSEDSRFAITFANNVKDIDSSNITIYTLKQINDIKKCINIAYKISPK